MKLLTRLRELRNEIGNDSTRNQSTINDQHLETIGVGATTIDDILRLNIAYTHFENRQYHPK